MATLLEPLSKCQGTAKTDAERKKLKRKIQWHKEGLLDKLQNWLSGKKMNWSGLGRDFNTPGANKGQVVESMFITLTICPSHTRLWAHKLRMPGTEVSVPTHRTAEGIRKDLVNMIESGELTLGEPCYPHKLKKNM